VVSGDSELCINYRLICSVRVAGVNETDQRRHCLELGERSGLDIFSITKLVVETIGNAASADFIAIVDSQLNAATCDVSIITSLACDIRITGICRCSINVNSILICHSNILCQQNAINIAVSANFDTVGSASVKTSRLCKFFCNRILIFL